jgi:hypothetical protein
MWRPIKLSREVSWLRRRQRAVRFRRARYDLVVHRSCVGARVAPPFRSVAGKLVNPKKLFRVSVAEIRQRVEAMALQDSWTVSADAQYRESRDRAFAGGKQHAGTGIVAGSNTNRSVRSGPYGAVGRPPQAPVFQADFIIGNVRHHRPSPTVHQENIIEHRRSMWLFIRYFLPCAKLWCLLVP